jgi:hypothetical protein
MMTPGGYNVAQQSSDGTGFCVEHVVGPISTSQVFFLGQENFYNILIFDYSFFSIFLFN